MATPTWSRVPYPEAVVSRTIFFGWVLVQLAGASGEWHLPPAPIGHPALRRGDCPGCRGLPLLYVGVPAALTVLGAVRPQRLNEPGPGAGRRE